MLQVAGAPAGDIEKPVVHRQIDVGDQRRAGLESLEHRGKLIFAGGFGRDLDHLLHRPLVAVAIPGPDRGRQVLQAHHAVDEAVGLGRIVRRPEFEHELVLVAEVDGLQVLAFLQIPEVQSPAVLGAEQHFGDQPVLDCVGRAPLAGDQRIVAEVPPGIIGEILRPAIHLPLPEHVEALVIHQEETGADADRAQIDQVSSPEERTCHDRDRERVPERDR